MIILVCLPALRPSNSAIISCAVDTRVMSPCSCVTPTMGAISAYIPFVNQKAWFTIIELRFVAYVPWVPCKSTATTLAPEVASAAAAAPSSA